MKCPGCGADYSVRLKKCPYCGRVNETALLREKEKKEKRGLLGRLRTRTLREAEPEIVLKVLNRIILTLVLIWALILGTVYMAGVISEKKEEAKKASMTMEEHMDNLEELKCSGDYEGLCSYLSEYSISQYEGEAEEYWQVYDIYRDMRSFWESADRLGRLSAEERKTDNWRYSSLAADIFAVWEYGDSSYEWDLVLPANEELYREWREQVDLYLRTEYGMTEEELKEWSADLHYEKEAPFGELLQERAVAYGEG